MTKFEFGLTLVMVLAALCGLILTTLDFIKLVRQTKPSGLPPPDRACERGCFREDCR